MQNGDNSIEYKKNKTKYGLEKRIIGRIYQKNKKLVGYFTDI